MGQDALSLPLAEHDCLNNTKKLSDSGQLSDKVKAWLKQVTKDPLDNL